jgi:hypothetical protein
MTNLLAAFLFAVVQVEGNPRSPYGLTKGAISDVNKAHGTRWTWEDRKNARKARIILVGYVVMHYPKDKPFDPCTAGRIVRYGPSGATMHARDDREQYGQRVANLTEARMRGDA